jgi:hypothetical protein
VSKGNPGIFASVIAPLRVPLALERGLENKTGLELELPPLLCLGAFGCFGVFGCLGALATRLAAFLPALACVACFRLRAIN